PLTLAFYPASSPPPRTPPPFPYTTLFRSCTFLLSAAGIAPGSIGGVSVRYGVSTSYARRVLNPQGAIRSSSFFGGWWMATNTPLVIGCAGRSVSLRPPHSIKPDGT